MLVFGRSTVVMALPCCPSREPHAPTWGAPGLSRGRFLSLEGRGVVPGGLRSGVRLEKRVYPHLLRHSDSIERLRQTRNPQGSPGSPGSRQSPDDPSLSLHPPGGGLALQLVTGYATKDHLPMRGSHYPELARREHYAFLNEGRVPWLFMALCL